MGYIFGASGFGRLAVGYPININDMDVKAFTVDNSAPEDGIEPGALLIFTSTANSFTTTSNLGKATDYAGKIAGIALATNVKLDRVFPQSEENPTWLRGEAAGCAVRGEIAVKLAGTTAPTPGAKAYYDIAKSGFTPTAEGNLELPNMRFTGNTEGDVTVVDILY